MAPEENESTTPPVAPASPATPTEPPAPPVEPPTPPVEPPTPPAKGAEITLEDLATELRALPEKFARAYKEMNPPPKPPAKVRQSADTHSGGRALDIHRKGAEEPGRKTFAQRWFGQ